MTDKKIYLKDYAPFDFVVEDVRLVFRLHPQRTRVFSSIKFRPNEKTDTARFFLNGENLKLNWARIDGKEVFPTVTDKGLTLDVPDDETFIWESEVEINPEANTELEGLYMSNGLYCTQCEAEGFRKITYYPDRPDVMAPFRVRIESREKILLANGNPTASGEGWAEWDDPWPKPSYLFALVAGDLVRNTADFITASDELVELNIWVRPGDEAKTAYAMDSLKRSMKWDEETYGREYDLSVFNIVAVDDFNAGAMENKGLNIFNSKYVLASPQTATDADYESIESIIAHEYFHNWTGNRITCRDWFQLSLKEGLTVLRDQQFTSDMRSAAVKRINDVVDLRAYQFREDSGPLAHPVRPESFVEIDNFYTATVYEKGAEVIGMLKTLVGDEAYKKALDLYFERHDGEATTIEAWLQVFADVTGKDLGQFKRWYSQAGTPVVMVAETFENGTYNLTLSQSTAPTPGQDQKEPFVIPVAIGLLNPNGDEILPTTVLELNRESQTFSFTGLAAKPTASILRNFSAPVTLRHDLSRQERAFLMAHDTDPFNKWEAGRALGKDVLAGMITDAKETDPLFLDAMFALVTNDRLDPAFRAAALALPGEEDMARSLSQAGQVPDPLLIRKKRDALAQALAARLSPVALDLYDSLYNRGRFSPDARSAGNRALRNRLLGFISRMDDGKTAKIQFDNANNMTDQFAALSHLIDSAHSAEVVASFYDQWKEEKNVVDKWFTVQTAYARPENALAVAKSLESHPDFNWKTPNRVRALLNGIVTGNQAAFHASDGKTYQWWADWIIRLDGTNPQVAAGATRPFGTWRIFDADRQGMICDALKRIAATPNLSPNTSEMVARLMAD